MNPTSRLPALVLVLVGGLSLWPSTVLAGDRDIGPVAAAADIVEGRKVALVVGNGAYQHVERVDQAPKDAKLIADTLKGLGFEVKSYTDLEHRSLSRVAADFDAQLEGAAVGFFYYAGHGVQVDGHNYLVPVDAQISGEQYVESEAVDVTKVLQSMDRAHSRLNVVVLDACRNNPFAGQWAAKGRSVTTSGLAGVDVAPRGSVIAYATAPGWVAADDGVYARSLATHLKEPGAEITDVFRLVYQDVQGASKSGQSPWYTESRNPGRFYAAGVPVIAKKLAAAHAVAPPKKKSLPTLIQPAVPTTTRARDAGATQYILT